MSDFSYCPSVMAEMTVEPRVRRAVFGDGYEQRIADGINTMPERWDLSFSTSALVDAIEAQLAGYGGVTSFTWTNPKGVEIRVVCRSWSRTIVDKNHSSLRAVFEQVFES